MRPQQVAKVSAVTVIEAGTSISMKSSPLEPRMPWPAHEIPKTKDIVYKGERDEVMGGRQSDNCQQDAVYIPNLLSSSILERKTRSVTRLVTRHTFDSKAPSKFDVQTIPVFD